MAFQNKGNFIPTTQSWDVTELYQTDINNPKFKELLVRMYQNLNLMAESVNNKSSGIYNTNEVASGETFSPSPSSSSISDTRALPRPIFRKVINFGALPAASGSPKSVAHGIAFNANTSLVRLYGSATNPSAISMIPIPYTSGAVPTRAVGIILDATNVTITISPGSNYSAYTKTYIVIEFMKN